MRSNPSSTPLSFPDSLVHEPDAPTLVDQVLIDLPDEPVPSDLVSAVERAVGKSIVVERVGDSSWGALTGLLLETPKGVRILVRECDPPIYQLHCLLHELGHLVLQHADCASVHSERAVEEDVVLARGRLLADRSSAAEELAAEAVAFRLAGRLLVKARSAPFGL